MLIMTTFVDNLERGAYDIPFIIKNWEADRLVIFAGSQRTLDVLNATPGLKRDNLSIINIGHPVVYAHDIPVAFNACEDYCYDKLGADSVILSHADVYLTKPGMDRIAKSCQAHITDALCYNHVQLYVNLWIAEGSVILSHSDKRIYWDESDDGTAWDRARSNADQGKDYCDDVSLVLDNGYFTVRQYRAKLFNHNFIWPDSYKTTVLEDFNKDVRLGLDTAYLKIRKVIGGGAKLNPIDCNVYKDLLDEYAVWEEFTMCMEVLEKVNRKHVN